MRKFIGLVLVAMLAGAAAAQDVSVRADHPDEYVVVRGDTLWDIAGRFLDKPWQWPAIWHANPQIANPHLIYPGDRISLIYIDGMPRLVVDRGKQPIKLSPEMRSTGREAIPPIPYERLKPFIKNARIVSEAEFLSLPYIIANYEQRLNVTVGDRTYARGLTAAVGQEFVVARLNNIYYRMSDTKRRAEPTLHGDTTSKALTLPRGFWRPVDTWFRSTDIIGYELVEVSRAVVKKAGDPAILEVESGRTEVQDGDYLLPLDDHRFDSHFYPRPMSAMPGDMLVLAVEGGIHGVGQFQIVAISGGANQGVEPGHVFSAFRPGETVRDKVKYPKGSWADATTWSKDKVTLPAEFDAHIMVFRVFDEVSYAMVMDGERMVHEHDELRHPDETL